MPFILYLKTISLCRFSSPANKYQQSIDFPSPLLVLLPATEAEPNFISSEQAFNNSYLYNKKMKVHDLKYDILDKLISVEDEGLLKKINALIGDIDLEERPIKVSDAQRQMLMDSEQDIINENLVSDEEVNEEEERWLKE